MTNLQDQHGHRKYLTSAERDAFLAATNDAEVREVRTFGATLAYTGCRISEALALTAESLPLLRLRLDPKRSGCHLKNRLRGSALHRRDKPVSLAREGFDVPGPVGGVAQGLPELVDDRVQALLKIDERRALPQMPLQLLPTHYLAGLLKQ